MRTEWRDKVPEWLVEGYRRSGPYHLICPKCGKRISTNALGRAAHTQACHRKSTAHREDG